MFIEKERTIKENVAQLEIQYLKQIEDTITHCDKILDARLKEQERLLKEGFNEEVGRLKHEMDATREYYEKDKETWTGKLKDLLHYKSKAKKDYEEMQQNVETFMKEKNDMETKITELQTKTKKSDSDQVQIKKLIQEKNKLLEDLKKEKNGKLLKKSNCKIM